MFQANNLVRSRLVGDQQQRARRAQLVRQAVQSQIGMESRHLRRLGIMMQGLQMAGYDAATVDGEVGGVEWLNEVVDELILMAGAEVPPGVSQEGGWDLELRTLRRWLAEDRLVPEREIDDMQDPEARPSESDEARNEETADQDVETQEDDSCLMQRGKGLPWSRGRGERSRSGSRRDEGARRRRQRRERRDRDTNAQRPWRTSSFMSAKAKPKPRPTSRTTHPAVVEVNGSETNLGVHVWHCLLDMASRLEAPMEGVDYGLTPTQRDNVEQTLTDMNIHERLHMLFYYLRLISYLTLDIMAIAEQVQERGTEEGEGTGFMQKFIRDKDGADPRGPHLFNSGFELHLRSLIAALEMSPPMIALRRAQSLLERVET